ncbi:MarR family transcriptional regulator [Nakamurella sp. DB0629]|uniref:MarR family transcriptional regulator n=1 Tax=Nakamurella aerolata TaxID=1656892 RepID=A0A849ALE4_9ACTN|nr:MarR family transcriptional regulator [Nakamurella aerolata]NNG37632.1 MarR family transcriptional regulator [Nakamurella aerolata]
MRLVGAQTRGTIAAESAEVDELAEGWQQLVRRFHRITCQLDRALSAAHGLTSSEFTVLEQMYQAGGSVRMSELAQTACVTQSALSRLVGRLHDDGLLRRKTCDADRRSVSAELTPAGKRRYLQARETQRKILQTEADDCPVTTAMLRDGNRAAG